jgi:tetratricopeptide (TPR) repeat protein
VAWQRREHRIATIAANAKFHEMEQELPILWGLAETETLDAPRSNEFINRTAKIFADYRLESLSSWKDMPDIARLPAEHQVHLVEHLCLLTFVRFEMALSEATQTSGDDRHRLLAQARLDLDRLRCLGLDASNSPAIRREASRLATLEGDSMVTDPEIPAQDLAANAALLEKRLSALQLMRARRFTEALPLLQELATQRPDDIALMLQLGNCYRALRRWSSAEACYLACGALRPDLTFPFYFQGLLHLEQRQYAASVHAFSKSLALEEDVGARINLALAYRGLGNHQKAIDNLSRAIELGTSETRVWLLLSQSYEQLGKPEAAMRAREMWSTSKPADVLSWIAFGVDQLPTDASAAESAFREALKLDPSSLAALQNLAHVLAERKNQPQEALDVLTTALAQSPHDPLLLGSRAVLAARIGDQKCARRDADQALAVAPTSAMARYQAACVLTLLAPEDSASRAQALDLLEKTVALEPNLGTLFVADTDLRPLRSEKRFVDIVALANRLNQTRPISPQDDREQGE